MFQIIGENYNEFELMAANLFDSLCMTHAIVSEQLTCYNASKFN